MCIHLTKKKARKPQQNFPLKYVSEARWLKGAGDDGICTFFSFFSCFFVHGWRGFAVIGLTHSSHFEVSCPPPCQQSHSCGRWSEKKNYLRLLFFFFFFSLSSSQVYVKAEWIFSFLACWFPSYCCFPVAPAGLHWGAELGTAHTHTHEKRLLCPPEGTRSKEVFPVSGGIMSQNWNLRWMLEFLLNVSVDCPLMVCIWFLKLVSYLLSPVPCIFLPATGRQRFTLILKPQTATNKHTAAYT